MRAADVREVFESILPDTTIAELVRKTGFQERDRKLDAVKFVRAMVIAAATRYGGRQTDQGREPSSLEASKRVPT